MDRYRGCGRRGLDSGIFLSVESLCGDSLLSPVAGFNAITSGTSVQFANATRYATAWHWDFGDGATSNERYPAHTYADLDQPYTVRLVATNWCCSDTAYVSVGTSRLQEDASPRLSVYPTHIGDVVVIDPADPGLSGTLTLTDVSGRTLMQQPFSGKTTLQTAALSQGVYFLSIYVAGKNAVVQKLVK
jgi:FOG: PKD repeat